MKKIRTMRAAALLLVLTLMTSCFVGGTFAKYVTSDSATDTARVAEWGIEVLASGNLFGKDYAKYVDGATDGEDRITVATSESVSAEANVVAPGTKNDEGLTVKVTGQPEVSYSVSAAASNVKDMYLGTGKWGVLVEAGGLNAATDVTAYYVSDGAGGYVKATGAWSNSEHYYELHDAIDVGAAYYPLKWKLNGTGYDTVNDALTALDTAFTYTGNANAPADKTYTLTWEWLFTVDAATDAKDTILGNLFAGNTVGIVVVSTDGGTKYAAPASNEVPAAGTYFTTTSFDFSVTVEQTN